MQIIITDNQKKIKLNQRRIRFIALKALKMLSQPEETQVALSFVTIYRIKTRRYGSSFDNELSLYVIHGLLHLLGYDDTSSGAESKMRKKQQELLGKICR